MIAHAKLNPLKSSLLQEILHQQTHITSSKGDQIFKKANENLKPFRKCFFFKSQTAGKNGGSQKENKKTIIPM